MVFIRAWDVPGHNFSFYTGMVDLGRMNSRPGSAQDKHPCSGRSYVSWMKIGPKLASKLDSDLDQDQGLWKALI